MLKTAFINNELLGKIDETQIIQLVNRMKPKIYGQDNYVINENEIGDALYVIEEGKVNVIKGDKLLNIEPLGPSTLFGELALLYDCRRTASILAVTDLKLWYLQRKNFQLIMKINIKIKRSETYKFLKTVNIFEKITESNLLKIVDTIQTKFFTQSNCIIKENEEGRDFFIIISGEVKICKIDELDQQDKEIRTLKSGDYFGEKALLAFYF
ncbi:hypothetical protein HZS_365 [Henneguya salminicola]|nr:hypothetical protein HZS_365 [Henneguya salminicola]